MATHEEDRAAYLAGEEVSTLPAAERAELDELRGLLTSTAAWAEPSAGLEHRVVSAIVDEAGSRPATTRDRRKPARRLRLWSRPSFALGGLAGAAAAAA